MRRPIREPAGKRSARTGTSGPDLSNSRPSLKARRNPPKAAADDDGNSRERDIDTSTGKNELPRLKARSRARPKTGVSVFALGLVGGLLLGLVLVGGAGASYWFIHRNQNVNKIDGQSRHENAPQHPQVQ
jgi:hypothetical protein